MLLGNDNPPSATKLLMDLCNLCQAFDIRSLLFTSASQKVEPRQFTGINNSQFNDADHYHSIVGADDYHQPIPHFYSHYKTIVDLKRSAENGCKLCALFWRTWIAELAKATHANFSEEWLNRNFQGEVFIGASGWSASRQGMPYVTLTQRTPTGQARILCSFDAFARREDVPSDIPGLLGRAVYPESNSTECLAVAKEWLQTCLYEHEKCKPIGASHRSLPTRVIAVGDEEVPPKLLAKSNSLETYVALSYCWGGDSDFVLNVHTMHDLQRGIPLADYPATLRDAIVITRSLGIEYLWVDALCIQQDSAEDWAKEAAKMRDVYAGAILAIAAANSPSTKSGIFSKRNSRDTIVPIEWEDYREPTSKVYLRPGSELWDHNLQLSPLMGRGWTLQEGLLAPRTLSYGAQQMIWECPQCQVDEGGRMTQASEDYRVKGFIQRLIQREKEPAANKRRGTLLSRLALRRPPHTDEWWKIYSITNPFDKWYDIYREFTTRSLTKDFDVLPALSGLARVFQNVVQSDYCAGMWKQDHVYSLLWYRNPRYPTDGSARFDPARPSEYLAPSWSWASILGKQASMNFPTKVRYTLSRNARSFDGAKVISWSTVPKGPDPFGQVVAGELTLRARFCELDAVPPTYSLENQWPKDDEPSTPRSKSAFQNHVYRVLLTGDERVYEFYQQHVPHAGQHFGVIEIVPWKVAPGSGSPGIDCLIVESTGLKTDEYRRVGVLRMRKDPVPNKEDVAEEAYKYILLENEAYDEVMKGGNLRWKKRTVTLV